MNEKEYLLKIETTTREVFIGNIKISLTPMELVYYLYFAERAASDLGPQILSDKENLELFIEKIIEYHKENFPGGTAQRRSIVNDLNQLRRGRDTKTYLGNYRAIISKCNKKIRKSLQNLETRENFEIKIGGSRGGKTYGLDVSPDKIKIPSPKVYPTFKQKIKCFEANIPLSRALAEMKKNNYSQVVLKTQGKLRLITTDGLATWLIKIMNSKALNLNNIILSNISVYERDDNISFFSRNRTVVDARKEFSESLSLNRPKLFAIIITETGKSTEEPLGIITPWDFLDPKYW